MDPTVVHGNELEPVSGIEPAINHESFKISRVMRVDDQVTASKNVCAVYRNGARGTNMAEVFEPQGIFRMERQIDFAV
jgi:hypothetical protein